VQQHESQTAVTEQTPATATASATAFATLTAGIVAPTETAVTITLATAAPSMAHTAPFVAQLHIVQVQRASAHEIAT
jgi:hypothetical protein